MKKVWAWLKKNWKWLIAPLWILSLVLVWLFAGDGRPLFKPSGTTDKMADELAEEKEKILAEYREKMGDLAKRVEEKLQDASKEQLEEFKEMKDKPPEEIAKWIDQF
jgi:flagellar biosynthesis/type III secretory pathway M-ring protein FliF/YscJ